MGMELELSIVLCQALEYVFLFIHDSDFISDVICEY